MPWFNIKFAGADAVEADENEKGEFLDTGSTERTLPEDIIITDMVLEATAAAAHRYRLYVNGRQQLQSFSAAQMNPATEGRVAWGSQGIAVGRGSTFQVRGAQKSVVGGAAEETILSIFYRTSSGEGA